MRKEWMEPVIKVQEFVANEYVAACESGMVYKFECNAPAGDLYYYPKSDGKIDGTYTGSGRARLLGPYHPCGTKHDASATSAFYDGFIDYDGNGIQDPNEGVIVWRGPWGRNGHATKDLNMSSWGTAKS